MESNKRGLYTDEEVKEILDESLKKDLDSLRGSSRVHHPPHYNKHPSGIECIEIVRHLTFNEGNAMKYLWRAGLKDSTTAIEDLEKAKWYIEDQIRLLKGDYTK